MRTYVTLEEGIAHYGTLTPQDVDRVEGIVLAAGADKAYLVDSNAHVGFETADRRVVAYLTPSYLTVTPRAEVMPEGDRPTTDHIEPGGVDVFLSPWGSARQADSRTVLQYGDPCPTCYVAMSVSGACDYCD